MRDRKLGFTLVEILLVLATIAFLVAAVIKIAKDKTNFVARIKLWSVYDNLQQATAEIAGAGVYGTAYNNYTKFNYDAGYKNVTAYDSYGNAFTTSQFFDNSTSVKLSSLVNTTHLMLPDTIHKDDNYSGYCDRLSDILNIVGSASCAPKGIGATGATEFSNPHLQLSNGEAYYFSDYLYTDQTNGIKTPPSTSPKDEYFIVFVDSNGPKKGTNKLDDDVYKFRVYLTGLVLPEDPQYENVKNFSTTTYYNEAVGAFKTLQKQIVGNPNETFKKSVCQAGITASSSYCGEITKADICNSKDCDVHVNKPGIFGFKKLK